MSRVRNKDTKPELKVRSTLHRAGYRFRLHGRTLPGSPDIVLPKHHTVIFVHGCFWHGHEGCRRSKLPATRTEFWAVKISRNKERDRNAEQELIALGYRVVTLWECELRSNSLILSRVDSVTGAGRSLEAIKRELDGVHARMSSGHDVFPFMTRILLSSEAAFKPLPPEMLEILRSSIDYQSLQPGAPPTWLQVASDNESIEVVVYRAEIDGKHYVLAPNETN